MAWGDNDPLQREIITDLAALTPLADFVLVKPLSDDAEMRLQEFGSEAITIYNPRVHMTQDYRWRSDRPRGNRLGEVVACGPGDLAAHLYCETCQELRKRIVKTGEGTHAQSIGGKCDQCGDALSIFPRWGTGPEAEIVSTERMPMNVRVGDIVVFPRVPNNELRINGEDFCFLHEEQHVLAVIEKEAA